MTAGSGSQTEVGGSDGNVRATGPEPIGRRLLTLPHGDGPPSSPWVDAVDPVDGPPAGHTDRPARPREPGEPRPPSARRLLLAVAAVAALALLVGLGWSTRGRGEVAAGSGAGAGNPVAAAFRAGPAGDQAPVTDPPPAEPVPAVPSPSTRALAAVGPGRHGQWSEVVNLPLVPVAAADLPDGRVLMWSANGTDHFGGAHGFTQTVVYDPVTSTPGPRLVANTGHDMFCPGIARLTDGRILVNGGSTSAATSLYDPATGRWDKGPTMNIPRGYAGTVALADGSAFTLGGSFNTPAGGKDGEIWTGDGGWRRLPGVTADTFTGPDPAGPAKGDNHPWLFAWTQGRVFHAGPTAEMHWIDTSGAGSVSSAGRRGDDTYAMNGDAVMYAPGRILTVGGAPAYDGGVGTDRATVIDLNGPTVTARPVAPMANPRALANSVVLPDGEVVVVGGQSVTRLFNDAGAVLATEIWDPATETFRAAAAMTVPRTYHSFALLQADGRVLVGGGGLCGMCDANHPNVQVYSPPYLFAADGSPAVRPQILSAPASVDLGQQFPVTTSSPVSQLVLVRLGTATHSLDTDQRRIPLTVVAGPGDGSYHAVAPTDPGVAVPGSYMLFALDANGVPSVAKTVTITGRAADTSPVALAGTVSDFDGSAAAGVAIDLFEAQADGTRGAWLSTTRTDATGRYHFDVKPGCYVLTFIAPDGRSFADASRWYQPMACVDGGRPPPEVDAELDPTGVSGATVRGRVTVTGGAPAAGVAVEVHRARADGSKGRLAASTRTAADGSYRLDVPSGCYVLSFTAPAGGRFVTGGTTYDPSACTRPGEAIAVDAQLATLPGAT